MTTWHVLAAQLDANIESARTEPPTEVVQLLRYGVSPHGAGTDGQCFSTWVFVAGDVRYLAFYGASNLVALSRREEFTLEILRAMARQYLRLSANFLGYCGLEELWSLTQRLLECLNEVDDKNAAVALIERYGMLAAMYNQWVQHYFPWAIGYAFPQNTEERLVEAIQVSQGAAAD